MGCPHTPGYRCHLDVSFARHTGRSCQGSNPTNYKEVKLDGAVCHVEPNEMSQMTNMRDSVTPSRGPLDMLLAKVCHKILLKERVIGRDLQQDLVAG